MKCCTSIFKKFKNVSNKILMKNSYNQDRKFYLNVVITFLKLNIL